MKTNSSSEEILEEAFFEQETNSQEFIAQLSLLAERVPEIVSKEENLEILRDLISFHEEQLKIREEQLKRQKQNYEQEKFDLEGEIEKLNVLLQEKAEENKKLETKLSKEKKKL